MFNYTFFLNKLQHHSLNMMLLQYHIFYTIFFWQLEEVIHLIIR